MMLKVPSKVVKSRMVTTMVCHQNGNFPDVIVTQKAIISSTGCEICDRPMVLELYPINITLNLIQLRYRTKFT